MWTSGARGEIKLFHQRSLVTEPCSKGFLLQLCWSFRSFKKAENLTGTGKHGVHHIRLLLIVAGPSTWPIIHFLVFVTYDIISHDHRWAVRSAVQHPQRGMLVAPPTLGSRECLWQWRFNRAILCMIYHRLGKHMNLCGQGLPPAILEWFSQEAALGTGSPRRLSTGRTDPSRHLTTSRSVCDTCFEPSFERLGLSHPLSWRK